MFRRGQVVKFGPWALGLGLGGGGLQVETLAQSVEREKEEMIEDEVPHVPPP